MSESIWYGSPQFKTREQQLEYDLKIARQRLQDMEDKPAIFAVIMNVEGDRCTICTGPQIIDLKKPVAMQGIEPGAIARIRGGDPPSILSIVKNPPLSGAVVTVKQLIDEHHAEVNVQNQMRVVMLRPGLTVRAGDRVIIDFTNNTALSNLGQGDSSKAFTEATGVTWDDIGGLDEAKAYLIEAIEEPVKFKELYKKYNKQPTRGILLHGPPGCGKTILGKACATALAKVHGDSARKGGFLYVKGPEMLNMFVGNSEANIRSLFSAAREHALREGYPAIVFIDEADALMGKRGATRYEGMERTIVPQFLAEMDGLEDSGAMVLLATNRPDTLDPAVVRPGRVDKKIFVRRPTEPEAVHIFSLYLARVPAANGVSHHDLAVEGAKQLFSDLHGFYMVRVKGGTDRRFGIANIVSGALIASLVNNVSQMALRRERDKVGLHGVTFEDMKTVVQEAVVESKNLDHSEALSLFFEENKLDVTKVDRI